MNDLPSLGWLYIGPDGNLVSVGHVVKKGRGYAVFVDDMITGLRTRVRLKDFNNNYTREET